jgi:hypothetical protein
MENTFDSIDYAVNVAQELISAFETASRATTPSLVGSARESSVKKKLEHLLPAGIAIGSGCVIDSYGNTSKQQDVILYERDFCPVFSVNENPETTYYPCEGVIAVGEIKSSVGDKELKDIFKKIESVKCLKRFAKASKSVLVPTDPTVCYRCYGSKLAAEGAKSEEYNQDEKPFDQIFGFALAGKLSLKKETFCEKIKKLMESTNEALSPNLIISLTDGIVAPVAHFPPVKSEILFSRKGSNGYYFSDKSKENFQFLLSRLYDAYRQGRTVELSAFSRYITRDGKLTMPLNGVFIPL